MECAVGFEIQVISTIHLINAALAVVTERRLLANAFGVAVSLGTTPRRSGAATALPLSGHL